MSLRSVVPCLTLLCLSLALLLAAPDARAGTYVGIYTDFKTHALSQYSQGTHYSATGPRSQDGHLPFGDQPDSMYTNKANQQAYGGGSETVPNDGTKADCSGSIQTAWKWVPAQNMDMTTDPPPSQVLIMQTCTVSVTLEEPGETGSYRTGLGQRGTISFNPPDHLTGSATDTKYFVKSGGATVNLDALDAQANVTNAPAGASVSYTAAVYPIVLAAPDPMGHPELGDGKNQEVYDATAPSGTAPYGFLKFPGSISVVGSDAAGTAWIMRGSNNGPIVALTLDLPAETVTQGWQLYDQTILASVPASSLVVKNGPYIDSNTPMNDGFSYAGLPKLNTGFGNHLVTLTVNGSTAQQAHIQTFFTGTASNYPTSATDQNTNGFITPNWYYYYNQVYASTGGYDSVSSYSYTDAHSPQTYPIHIANDAYESGIIRVFDLPAATPNYVRYVGYLDVQGIYSYIYTCAHERGHQILLAQGNIYNFNSDPANTSPISTDGDHVSDAWEVNHHLDPTLSDTAMAYGTLDNGDKGDDELLADVQALPVLFQQAAAWQQDWANGGVQAGANTYSTGTPKGFPWTFHATANGTSMTVGNSYPIHSLNDLKQQYPTLLIALP